MSKVLLCVVLTVGLVLGAGAATAAHAQDTLKVLVVTGGHGFKHKPFFQVFEDMPGVEFAHAKQGKTATPYERDDLLSYDSVVLYDMVQNITEEQKKAFLSLLDKGVGLVVLHHALASYQGWPKYEEVVGGKFLLKPGTVDGKTVKRSVWGHLELTLNVVDKDHPITKGLEDITWHDEYYGKCRVSDDVTVLLTTECPKSQPQVMWCKEAGKSRVVYLMGGHGPGVYKRPEYRTLVANSIRWTARR
jgi:hypothetical protein